MLLLSLFFSFSTALAIQRIQKHCVDLLQRARPTAFDANALAEGLTGHSFLFDNNSKRPLTGVELQAFGLPDDHEARADEMTFQFSAGDGAGLRIWALQRQERVGGRNLVVNELVFGFVNLFQIVENLSAYRGMTLERAIARSLDGSLRASVPLTKIGTQWITLLFSIKEVAEGSFVVGPHIGVILARNCAADRIGPEVMLTDDGNICLTTLGFLHLPGHGPRRDPPPGATMSPGPSRNIQPPG